MTKKTNIEERSIKIVSFVLAYLVKMTWALVTGLIFMGLTRVLHNHVIVEVMPASYPSSFVIMLMVIFICEAISRAINFDSDDYKE